MQRMTKTCIVCGGDFLTRSKSPVREKYCSPACRRRQGNQVHWRKYRHARIKWTPVERTCETCQKAFTAKNSRHVTCSLLCNQQRQDRRKQARTLKNWDQTPRTCAVCGKSFVPGRYAWHLQKYFSRQCSSTAQTRKAPPRKSRVLPLPLRRLVDERSQGACELCGARPLQLERHHRDWDWRHNTPENLVVLCHRCHTGMDVKCRVDSEGTLILISEQWRWFPPDRIRFELPHEP